MTFSHYLTLEANFVSGFTALTVFSSTTVKDKLLNAVKCDSTKLKPKSNADWWLGHILKTVVVSGAWPKLMLTWFVSHTAAMVGDLAGLLVPHHPVGLLPSPTLLSLFFSTSWQCDGYLDTWRGS